jgi:hypothetical protein
LPLLWRIIGHDRALSRVAGTGGSGMAQKVTVALEDDLDGGPAAETVRFGFDGTE